MGADVQVFRGQVPARTVLPSPPYEIADGRHRVAAVLADGGTHILAHVWREYDDEPYTDPEVIAPAMVLPTENGH